MQRIKTFNSLTLLLKKLSILVNLDSLSVVMHKGWNNRPLRLNVKGLLFEEQASLRVLHNIKPPLMKTYKMCDEGFTKKHKCGWKNIIANEEMELSPACWEGYYVL